MSVSIWRLLAAFLVCITLQACVQPPKAFLDESARNVSDGREAIVVIPQSEIATKINPSNISAATGGGAVWFLVDAVVNDVKKNSAEQRAKSLRESLADYDFDHRALAATQESFHKVVWLADTKAIFTKDQRNDRLIELVDQSPTSQIVIARYEYTLSPNMKQLTVQLGVSIFTKETAHKSLSAPLTSGNALYGQNFLFVKFLPQPSDDVDQNAVQWAAAHGQLARAALDAGLPAVEDLFLRSITQSPEAVAALSQGRSVHFADYDGNVVESGNPGSLLYKKDSGTWIWLDGMAVPKS